MEAYGVFVAAVEFACELIGDVPTIILFGLIIGTVVGLAPFVMGFVIVRLLVLSVRRAAWRLRSHLRSTTDKYFERLKFKGLTIPSCRIAVWCSVVVWVGVLVAFAVHFWKETLILTLSALLVLSVAGWRVKGPKATFSRFVTAFYEPTLALIVPTVFMKSVDLAVRSIFGSWNWFV